MKLLIINNAGFLKSGDDYYITKTTGQFISEISLQQNINITLLQFAESGNINQGINDFKVSKSIVVKSIPYLRGIKKLYSYILGAKEIFKEISNTNSYVYIFYPGHIPILVCCACLIFRRPYGLYVRGEYNSIIANPIFKYANFINTVGFVFQKDIQRINSNCYLIKPMVQFDFSEKINTEMIQKKKEILFVGRIEKRKGVWEIAKAAEELKKSFPDYKFRLIGAGADSQNLAEHIEAKKLDNIILNGPVFNSEELKKYYMQAEIFLFPSHDEGFPRVLYEAMFFKVPIITTFVGNIPGIMQNEYNCLKINIQSSDSIVKQVHTLIKDKLLSSILIENGEKSLSLMFNDNTRSHSKLLTSQLFNND